MEQNSILLDVDKQQNLALNLFQTNNWLLEKYRIILGKHNLKYNQYYILKELKKSYPKPIPMYLMYHSIIDKNMNLSRVIDGLFNDNLVHRNQSTDDRRVVEVILTKKGLNVVQEAESHIEKFESLNIELDEKELTILNTLLNKIRSLKKMNFIFK